MMSEPVLPDVLPCPFCGTVAPDIVVTEDYRQQYGVQCDECGAGLYHYRTAVDAIGDWNRRPVLTERQQAILAAADVLRDTHKRTIALSRHEDMSASYISVYQDLAAAERALKLVACQDDKTTASVCNQEAGDG